MNLELVKAKLYSMYNSETLKSDVKNLIDEIEKEIEINKAQSDLSTVSATIDNYSDTLNTLEVEFLTYGEADIAKKIYNLNEQMCIINLINTFLAAIRMPEADIRTAKYIKTLSERKELYRGMSIQKTSCLKSLYIEREYQTKRIEYLIAKKSFQENG